MDILKKKVLLRLLKQFKEQQEKSLTAKQAVLLSMEILSAENGGISFDPSPSQLRDLQQGYKKMLSDMKKLTAYDINQIVSEDGDYIKYRTVRGAVQVNTAMEDIYQNYFGVQS